MEHLDARLLEDLGADRGLPEEVVTGFVRSRSYEVAALHKGERDIQAKRLVGELARFHDLTTDRVKLTGACFDNTHAAGVTD